MVAAGFAVAGLAVGFVAQALFKPKIKREVQRIGSLQEQTTKEGDPQPFIYGIARPIGGNVMYQSRPIVRVVKEYVGETKSGKGGGGGSKAQYQDVEHVYRHYAIRVCRGDGIGYRRIWRNGKLVYSAVGGEVENIEKNKAFEKYTRFYSGSWEQMPDPTLESLLGVGNVPAFRGLAYIVVENEDLTDMAGMIPQYTFEVARGEGVVLTSKLYPLMSTEKIGDIQYKTSVEKAKVDVEAITNLTYSTAVHKKMPIVLYELNERVGNLVYSTAVNKEMPIVRYNLGEKIGNLTYSTAVNKEMPIVRYNLGEKIGNLVYSTAVNKENKIIKFKYDIEKIGNLTYSTAVHKGK